MKNKNFVVTVARGFGSGGTSITAKLAKDLGIYYYDNWIHSLAAEISTLKESQIVENDEHLQGGYLISKLKALPMIFSSNPSKDFTENGKVYEIQSQIIRKLAESETCIIIGKCADHVLKDYDNVLSVYIEAPRLTCLHNVTHRMEIAAPEANKIITETDKYRADYYRFYTDGKRWNDPTNYDIVLNTGRLSEEQCVDIIKHCLKLKFGEDVFENIAQSSMTQYLKENL